MPIRVSDLGGKVRHLTFKWEGETVNFSYSPSRNSMKDSAELQEELERNPTRQYKALVDRLCRVLVGWDLLEDKNGEDKPDTMLPITEETLMSLPDEFVSAIFQTIRESQEVNPPRPRR